MKALRNLMVPLIAFVLSTGLALNFSGCTQQSPMQPGDNEAQSSIATLHKKGRKKEHRQGKKKEHKKGTYPQYTSRTFKYNNDRTGYQSGNMVVPGGSIFHLTEGALTPPEGTPHGESVTLTMLVEKITHGGKGKGKTELRFSFGPSGCQFNPPAEVWFDWSDLGVRKAMLYYIDDHGNYIELKPDKIDRKGHRFKLYIDHFSRYAVAWSN